MDETPAIPPTAPPRVRPALPAGLMALAIVDLAWAAASLALDAVLLLVGGLSAYLAHDEKDLAEGLKAAQMQWITIGAGALAAVFVNLFLFRCGLDILRRRDSAFRWQTRWLIGVTVLVVLDLFLLVSTWNMPASLCGVPFVLATPAWAALHVFVLGRPSSTAALAPLAS